MKTRAIQIYSTFIFIIITAIILQFPVVSAARKITQRDIIENGVKIEAELYETNKRFTNIQRRKNPFNKTYMLKRALLNYRTEYTATYEFIAKSGKGYRVDYITVNKKQITDTKTLYCLDYEKDECTWHYDDNDDQYVFYRFMITLIIVAFVSLLLRPYLKDR